MTYDYKCGGCGHEFQREQAISDPPKRDCPKCHKPKATRQISGSGAFMLKGTGWASDGYS